MFVQTHHPLNQGEWTTLVVNGHTIEFKRNERGDCVADVQSQLDVDAILSIGAGYSLYQQDAKPAEVAAPHAGGFDDLLARAVAAAKRAFS